MLDRFTRILRPAEVPSARVPTAGCGIAGHLDAIIDRELHGWCRAPSGTRLRIFADGVEIGTTVNDIMRDDVVAAGFANGPSGFSIRLPDRLHDGQEHDFEARSDSGIELQRRLRTAWMKPVPAARLKDARAAVVCWDLGHNPAGRAIVLVELLQRIYGHVDLIGPLFPRFGGTIWGPLAHQKRWSIISERVRSFEDIERFARRVAAVKYDAVHICKPRWPSLYIATEIARASRAKVVLDIDDYEMSFFPGDSALVDRDGICEEIRSGLVAMTEAESTALADRLIGAFPARTVSNVALQRKFGGTVIRHARDESTFDPRLYDRTRARHRFGFNPADKVVVFLGTVRRHKGVVQVAQAIAGLGRPDVKFCVIGPITDREVERELRDILRANVSFQPGVSFESLPRTLLVGDLVCLAQDMSSETSHYQIPAKLSDALAMGIPVIVQDLEPFADIKDMPGVTSRGSRPLADVIADVLARGADEGARARDSFLQEFSTEVNATRLDHVLEAIEPLADDALRELTERLAGKGDAPSLGDGAPSLIGKSGLDVVFLWKQNDSSLFGRRSDMVVKYLTRTPLARRILQFDAAISLDDLNRIKKAGESNPLAAECLVYRNIVARRLGLADEICTQRFSLVHDWQGASLFGAPLPKQADLAEVLREIFRKCGLSREAILWVCPAAFDFDSVMSAFEFQHVVADLIDDMRSFTTNERYIAKLTENYAKVLSRADTVFANCDGVAGRFQEMARSTIHVVSNASERLSRAAIDPIDLFPQENVLRIGYVGNMRDRFDADLIGRIATHNPNWRIILVGATGGNKDVEALRRHQNVCMLGPQKYEDACRLAAGFDVAIIPHQVNALTDSMNPLKLYLYQELDLPVVTTAVGNLTGANARVSIAGTHDEFIAAIERLEEVVPCAETGGPKTVYWDEQVKTMADVVSQRVARSAQSQSDTLPATA